MSFIEPNLGQQQQNKKILQELEEKKRRMRSSTAPIQALTDQPFSSSFVTVQPLNPQQQYPVESQQQFQQQQQQQQQQLQQPLAQQKPPQSFTQFYSSSTVGYFINTDSTFGNSLLPVLPRF